MVRTSGCGYPTVVAAAFLLNLQLVATRNTEISDGRPSNTTFNFLAIGDWGDDTADQRVNAAGMGAVAAEIGAAHVIALGDNFYHSNESHCDTSGGHYGGICNNNMDGIDGVDRFKSTFESVYTAESLRTIPWYAIAGNHDHAGNVTAQIAYTTNAQNAPLPSGRGLPAKRWNFPSYYYNVTQRVEVPGSGGKTVELEFLLIDSCIMAAGPPAVPPATAAAQLKWLEGRMESSTADYLWVGGHYPVWAIGTDPPTGVNLILRPLLHKWEANYMNGHEHDLEHIVEQGSKVNYICTGAGRSCCYKDQNLDTVPQGSIRFAASGSGGTDWWGRRPPNFQLLAGFVSAPYLPLVLTCPRPSCCPSSFGLSVS
jgi:tartrate-resistant acid phosphatase type 5